MVEAKIPLIVIAGPTGVGKTDLSIKIAQNFNGEIINGDSLQVYHGLDIGTGKIREAEKEGIPHHLLDILQVDEEFNAQKFKELSHKAIIAIYNRGNLPILVGGTGLYLEGLLYDLEFGYEEVSDSQVRQQLEAEAQSKGALALWKKLKNIDPKAADKIPYQNVRRTIRALQVIRETGKLFSSQDSHEMKKSTYDELLIVLDRPRNQLYDRINRRVLQMIDQGLEKEARSLYELSRGQDWQSMKGIGYKEWWPYIQGYMSQEQVIADIQKNSRRYAKRQLTWFRNRMKSQHWINMSQANALKESIQLVKNHLKKRKES